MSAVNEETSYLLFYARPDDKPDTWVLLVEKEIERYIGNFYTSREEIPLDSTTESVDRAVQLAAEEADCSPEDIDVKEESR